MWWQQPRAVRHQRKLFLHPAGRRGQPLGRWFFRIKYELPRFRPVLPGLLWQGRVKLNVGRRGIHVRYDAWTRACESGRWTHSKAQCSACGWWCSLVLLQPLEGDKLLQNNRQNIDDKAHFLFFYRSVSAHPCLGIFGSFGSLESGRKSLFSTATLFITQDLDDVVLLLLQSRKHSRTQTHARTHARTHPPTHTHPTIGKIYLLGPNLHNTATQTYCTSACGQAMCVEIAHVLAQGWISPIT